VATSFSGFVFKVQSGMNAAHRDRIAFIRVCSGVFERGMTLTHEPTGRPFATKYAHQFFGRERETVDLAWPGDVVGLVNANALRPGDTLFLDQPVRYPPIPRFAPEHFQVVNARDTSRHKQFHRGLTQLDREGVIQLLTSQHRGPQQPILGAVGQMQYEVVNDRMTHEFHCPVSLEPLAHTIAQLTTPAAVEVLSSEASVEVATGSDGSTIALFPNSWRLRSVKRDHPELVLAGLGVDGD
jgi:peptide chain release factor 3